LEKRFISMQTGYILSQLKQLASYPKLGVNYVGVLTMTSHLHKQQNRLYVGFCFVSGEAERANCFAHVEICKPELCFSAEKRARRGREKFLKKFIRDQFPASTIYQLVPT
jgi:hypothetical protein